jgi:hypothetical protein
MASLCQQGNGRKPVAIHTRLATSHAIDPVIEPSEPSSIPDVTASIRHPDSACRRSCASDLADALVSEVCAPLCA